MGEACKVFDTPVTGGNVSFYNESPTASVYPTPVIGMLGVIDDLSTMTTARFKHEGDIILLLGETRGHVGGSEYLAVVHGTIAGDAPPIDLAAEKRLHEATLASMRAGLVRSAHDCSEGGLAVALAECCILNPEKPMGATVGLDSATREDFKLYGEDQSRIVLTATDSEAADSILKICAEHRVPAAIIGKTGGQALKIGEVVEVGLDRLIAAYYGGIPDLIVQ
jgi:phosphoribosylformylglycinamidine (FGAM) synthase-like enzyme